MLKQKIILLLSLAAVLSALFSWQTATAQSDLTNAINGLTNAAVDAKLIKSAAEPGLNGYQILGRVINVALGLIGTLFLILTIYGGIQWMTARGNEEQAAKAMEMIAKAAIGMAIIVAAFLITNYVVFKIINIAQPTAAPTAPPAGQ